MAETGGLVVRAMQPKRNRAGFVFTNEETFVPASVLSADAKAKIKSDPYLVSVEAQSAPEGVKLVTRMGGGTPAEQEARIAKKKASRAKASSKE